MVKVRVRICACCRVRHYVPRVKRCPICAKAVELYDWIWNRIIYQPDYAWHDSSQIISWKEFHAWVVPELKKFFKNNPDGRPSIDRDDPDKTYCSGNLVLMCKRVNSARTRQRVLTVKQVQQIRSTPRKVKSDTDFALEFNVSCQTIGRCRSYKTYLLTPGIP